MLLYRSSYSIPAPKALEDPLDDNSKRNVLRLLKMEAVTIIHLTRTYFFSSVVNQTKNPFKKNWILKTQMLKICSMVSKSCPANQSIRAMMHSDLPSLFLSFCISTSTSPLGRVPTKLKHKGEKQKALSHPSGKYPATSNYVSPVPVQFIYFLPFELKTVSELVQERAAEAKVHASSSTHLALVCFFQQMGCASQLSLSYTPIGCVAECRT
jgi:hypothetical protein